MENKKTRDKRDIEEIVKLTAQYEEKQKEPSIQSILLGNIFLFGVWGYIGIWIWQGSEHYTYIRDMFYTGHIGLDLIVGLGTALVFMLFIYIGTSKNLLLFPDNKYTQPMREAASMKFGPFCLGLSSGIPEEWLFRGFLFGFLASLMHPLLAVIVASLIFMGIHIPQYKGHLGIHIYIFIYSIAMCIMFWQLGTLWGPMLAHVLYNVVVFHWMRQGRL
ncbi:hypothetical protein CN918_28230 [Priestia megaterium]|nr:hypothetical protein CN918_28230 [Priestia megaterium]